MKILFVDFWKGFCDPYNAFLHIFKKYGLQFEIDDNPDVLIFSAFGNENLKYKCKKILFTGEPSITDISSDKCITYIKHPHWEKTIISDYVIGFERISSEKYVRFPLYSFTSIINDKLNVPVFNEVVRPGFCIHILSNVMEERLNFLLMISKYKPVDISLNNYTKHFLETHSNITGVKTHTGDLFGKLSTIKNYKFSIAMENTNFDGYITEKLTDAIRGGNLPIYNGHPNIKKDFFTEYFINYSDFDSDTEFLEYIKKVDNNDKLFKSHLESLRYCRRLSDRYFEENVVKLITNL